MSAGPKSWQVLTLLLSMVLCGCAFHAPTAERVAPPTLAIGGVDIALVAPSGMVALSDIQGEDARLAERMLAQEVQPTERLLAVYSRPDLFRGEGTPCTAMVTVDRELESEAVSLELFQQMKQGMISALRVAGSRPARGFPVYALYAETPRSIQVMGLMPLTRSEVLVGAMSLVLVRQRVLGFALFSTAASQAEFLDLQRVHAQWVHAVLASNAEIDAVLAPETPASARSMPLDLAAGCAATEQGGVRR
jgi:hypothetical protein